jgi:hypothetical protein
LERPPEFLLRVPGSIADDVPVQVRARNRERARSVAGLAGDITITEQDIVRRLHRGRSAIVRVQAMAQADQAPTLIVRGRAVSKQKLSVRSVSVQGDLVLEHDADRVRESVRHHVL